MPVASGRHRRRMRLGRRLRGDLDDRDALTNEQKDKLALWKSSPWAFLTGTDVRATATLDYPYGRPIIWTKDERDLLEAPIKPFPAKGYLREYIQHIHSPRLKFKRFSLHEAAVHAIVKSRQMIVSTATLLYYKWACSFLEGRSVLVSKVTEDESVVLMADKIRFPWSRMPDWVRAQLPQTDKPRDKILFPNTDSRIVGVAMNVADREARGTTASDLFVDEAALQDSLDEMLSAAKPMVPRIIMVSTPRLGPQGSGAAVFREHVELSDDLNQERGDLALAAAAPRRRKPKDADSIPLHPPEPEPHEPQQGFSISLNTKRKCIVYRIHYSADVEKRDPRWAEGVRSTHTRSSFRREYEMDFTAPGEAPYYPEFADEWERHVAPLTKLIAAPVIRAWDFGREHPACLWLQISPSTFRTWVVRECLGTDINIWNFRDLVRYLSGQLSYDYLVQNRPQAKRWLSEMSRDKESVRFKDVPPWPWFAPSTHFIDYAGYEAELGSDRAGLEKGDYTRAQILAQAGIYLQTYQAGIEVGTETISQLCLDWPDGMPGLMVDPGCPLLLEGLKGGVCYPKATRANPVPTQPHKDGYYEHLHDCLRYGVSQQIPVDAQGRIQRGAPGAWSTGRRARKPVQDLAFGETRMDRWKAPQGALSTGSGDRGW